MVNYTDRDLDILTRTIIGEAGGESWDGQIAVAHTILNRSMDPRFPNTIAEVALQPKQFSAWNSGVGGNSLPRNATPDSPQYRRAQEAALAALTGQVADMTGGATHYYSPAGMQAHVDRGEQSNLLPKWLQDETNRRGGENFTLGGHVFTGRREGWQPPTDETITRETLESRPMWNNGSPVYSEDGAIIPQAAEEDGVLALAPGPLSARMDPRHTEWFDPVTGQRGQVVQPGPNIPFDQIGTPMPGPSVGPSGGPIAGANIGSVQGNPSGGIPGPGGRLSTQEAPMNPQDPSQSLLSSVFKFKDPAWYDARMQDKLLAIGAGLLSGNNWQEGLAGSAQNLLGLRQEDREAGLLRAEQMRDDRNAQRDQDFRLEQIDRQGAITAANQSALSQIRMQPVGNVQMKDGSVRGDLRFDGTNYIGPNGEILNDQVGIRVNNSDASGSKGQISGTDALKVQQELITTETELRSLDRVYAGLEDADYGISGVISDTQRFLNTLFERGLTEEQLQRGLTQSEIQGLIGATREQVVGGGVMTEQDALRVIMALGGDLKSVMSNPELMRRRLDVLREEKRRGYEIKHGQYETHRQQYPQLEYVEVPFYSGPTLDQSNGPLPNQDDIEAILKAQGL